MVITVGSTALQYFNMNRREPKDWDVWYSSDEIDWMACDGKDAMKYPQELLDLVPAVDGYATPDAIYTMKCSHLGWDVHWQKTKLDILWLKSKGCEILPELYEALIKEWKKEYGNKEFLQMKKSKEDFFTDEVVYVYDHDYLHELVAYPFPPVYTEVLKAGEDVLVDQNRFACLPLDIQIQMFREEITVIAIERWLVNPYWKGKVIWVEAYHMALKKTIVSLTKNWATDFIVQNLEWFVIPDYSYFKHALKTLEIEMSNDIRELFEKIYEEYSDEEYSSLSGMVYAMAEGDYCPKVDFEFTNDYPSWSLRDRDKVEYDRLDALWEGENNERRSLQTAAREKIGYTHLEQDGGGEGGTEHCTGVFKLGGKTYAADYQYYSHNGHEYDYIVDTLREVTPVVKTITVYE